MTDATARPAPEPATLPRPAAPDSREIASADLLRGTRAIRIRHGNDVYTLRLTSKGKLILTK